MSLLGTPHHTVPFDEEARCSSCPWPGGTACGGAEGVCEGNLAGPTPPRVHLVDRAARWAHELAEVERVIAERRGERNDTHVGAPLHEIVAALLVETEAEERYWGGVDMADRITPDVLARVIYPTAGGAGITEARNIRFRLATELGWPP